MLKLLFCVLLSSLAVINSEHVIARSFFANGTRNVKFSPTKLTLNTDYQISVKRIAKNVATYFNKDTVDGLHTELDLINLSDYVPGGLWEDDGLWVIKSSEVDGYYTINVKRYGDTLLSVASEQSAGGNYVQLATKNLNQYNAGGSKRSKALWTFWTSTYSDYFLLTPLSNSNAYLTYTFLESPSGRYLEVDSGNPNNYVPGGQWYDDAVFSFKEQSTNPVNPVNPGNMNLVNLQGLTAHNEYRSRHRNTGPLEYDASLAAFAQEWANNLASKEIFQHRPNNNYGENLAYYSVGGTLGGDTASKMWYDEIAYYNFNTGTGSGVIGHFTQLVWANTKKVGFGRAVSSRGNIYVVANYSPAGNYVGQYTSNVFPLISG